MKRIAVISAGVRAAALAAKAGIVNEICPGSFEIVIFERHEIGASWTGRFGFTDGRQQLCTAVERDLGFPYTCGLFPDQDDNQFVDDLMLKEYSWQAFNIANGAAYPEWISRGHPAPTHSDFAEYLRWAVVKSGFDALQSEALRLAYDTQANQWDVMTAHGWHTGFDAVVITGTQPRLDPFAVAGSPLAQYVATSFDFWRRIDDIHTILRDAANLNGVATVGIVGTGAAAATITAHFLRRACEIEADPSKLVEILLVGRSPFVAPRHPNYFQDRVFHDPAAWSRVPDKRDFIDQALFGSVWTSLVDRISADKRVTAETMMVRQARFLHTPTTYPATVVLDDVDPVTGAVISTSKALAFIVDARGQRMDWFLDHVHSNPRAAFLEPSLHAVLAPHAVPGKPLRDIVAAHLAPDFSVSMPGFPQGLHVPMLGSEIGPGATNLMSLGWVADSILRPYV